MRRFILITGLLLASPVVGLAQNNQDPHYRGEGYLFFGVGPAVVGVPEFIPSLGYSILNRRPVVEHAGFGGEAFLYKGLGLGAEVGYARWSTPGGFNEWAGIASADLSYHFPLKAAHSRLDPFVLGGYTLMFHHGSDSAGNFGGGLNLWIAKHAALRFEVRDETHSSLSPSGYRQILEFRVGLTFR